MQTLWKSVKVEGERARIALKVLETLTYSCDSPQDLYQLTSQVEELVTEFRGKLPQSEGIILRPEIRKSVRKRAQQILKKYSSLPLSVRRGRQKSDWHYRTRVGKKASELRKVKFASCRRIRHKLQHTQAAQKPARAITSSTSASLSGKHGN